MHYGHICTYVNIMLASLLQHNKDFKGVAVEAYMITVAFIKAFLSFISDYFK